MYYQTLAQNLIAQQKTLEIEIEKRKDSEEKLKKLFNDLKVSYKNLEQFSFVVSHNLRAPLTNIKGFLSLYEPDGDQETNDMVVMSAKEATENLDEVFTDLNKVLRSKKQIVEQKEDINILKLIEQIQKSLLNDSTNIQFTFENDIDPNLKINSVKSVLYSIIYNICQNAIKYSRKDIDSFLKISAQNESNKLILTFKDNGIGIDLSINREKIFSLYSRATTESKGKGIGLYLVKDQILMLGGEIAVESEINKGTTFIITLTK